MNRALPTYDAAEARNKLSHFTVQGYDLHGVVQAGANDGEEMISFINMGIQHLVAFEPLKKAFVELVKNCGIQVHCYMLGLHNKSQKAVLKDTGGDGKGASLFDVVEQHPEVQSSWPKREDVAGTEEIMLVRFDEWAEKVMKPEIDLANYDTLQLDTQGNEMEILEGMGRYLQGFKFLCIELSEVPVYRGETPGQQVIDWLEEKGFIQDSPLTAHNDTFFIRKDIKATSDQIYRGRC